LEIDTHVVFSIFARPLYDRNLLTELSWQAEGEFCFNLKRACQWSAVMDAELLDKYKLIPCFRSPMIDFVDSKPLSLYLSQHTRPYDPRSSEMMQSILSD